jgi:hypothetical protein
VDERPAGFKIDRIILLCAGGPDDPSNIQWQTDDDALAKDKEEAKLCRALRRAKKEPAAWA